MIRKNLVLNSNKAFTMTEVLVGSMVALYVILGILSLYDMSTNWYHETGRINQAQQIATLTLASIIDGREDATRAGDTIGSKTYNKRDGISCARSIAPITNSHRIDFALNSDPEGTNPRSFSLGIDAASGLYVLQYTDASGNSFNLAGTLGITDLTFSNPSIGLITVTVTVEKQSTIPGHVVRIVDSRSTYLRNS